MPHSKQPRHVFASHIGHTGKTTLCFQMSCFYAKNNPGERVLVMDFAEEGDLTKRLVGGVDNSRKVEEAFGSIHKVLKAAEGSQSALSKFFYGETAIDIDAHAMQVSKHNKHIPDNLYLITSGAMPFKEREPDEAQRKVQVGKILGGIEKSSHTWKLFCDTDGDRRPSYSTKVAYGLSQLCIVPLHLNKGDLDRTETMLGYAHGMLVDKMITMKVGLVVWNFVPSNKDEACEHKGNKFPFTPSKVSLELIDECNNRLCGIQKGLPGLFVHEKDSKDEFLKKSTTVIKHFPDSVQKSAEELGLPFVTMIDQMGSKATMSLKSGGVSYSADKKVVESVDAALKNVSEKFEAMSLSGGYGK